MGLTYRKKDSLEKLFEEFAIDPDAKKDTKKTDLSKNELDKQKITDITTLYCKCGV
ncbi:SPJ_0845 family protein [Vagococcus penaei]|uniref:SPJ_0845 family protein n=1 Tax=Vagococcus penaei TaxID=633807 RepID=UPI0014718413|nr:SPJ_0845 family protein [Vagococcus penaei]